MKKFLLFMLVIVSVNAANMYFNAFVDIKKAKRLLNSNPEQAQRLFIEAYSFLKQVVNTSIDENKPSANAFNLLGELYLNGWGVDQDKEKAIKFFCAAEKLGNSKAKKTIQKLNATCGTINIKELKQ